MKLRVTLTVFLMSVCLLYAVEKPSAAYPKEKIIYEIDAQRAADLEQAWSGLRRYTDRDHYITAIFASGDSTYSQYKLVELNRYGALVNVKFERIDDDDIWTVITIRASEILKLQVLEEK